MAKGMTRRAALGAMAAPELLGLNAHLVADADDPHEFCIHWKEEQRVSYA